MAKISLSVDKNYASDWKVYQGARELISNAKDADEDGHKMTIEHFPRTSRLEITNEGIYVDPSKLLILGKSDKQPGQRRGQFGEGFVLGVLALARLGFDVSFKNGDLSWSVSFEEPDEGHPFAGNELLTFRSRRLAAREADFRVEIEGVTTEIWDALKKFFLFLSPPKAKDTIVTREGTLLLEPERKGQVFARGIFVRAFQDLSCGYDMLNLKLDRDRRFIDEWDLHYTLGRMWKEACEKEPELASERVYVMAKESTPEARNVRYHADEKLLKSVREHFSKEHGEAAVPVSTMNEAKEIENVGGKPTMVSDALKELLSQGGLNAEAAKQQLEGQIEARYAPSDLNDAERAVVERMAALVPNFVVVSFKGAKPACRLIDERKIVGVDRRLLEEPFVALMKRVVTTEAQRQGIEPLDVLLARMAASPSAPETPPS